MGENDTISALTFCYNEESNFENSLKSIRPYVDEIGVVDLSSTDRTLEIAKMYADKIFVRPRLLCGDGYKMFLREQASCKWLLWFYGDEVFPEKTASALKTIISPGQFNAFSFMRREFRGDIPLHNHGTPDSPNYQNRLHLKCDEIFYTGLVHAELHGNYYTCPLPPEYYIEHRKNDSDQYVDNIRLSVWYRYLIWMYGKTQSEPWKVFIDSYRQTIKEGVVKNLDGSRKIHLAEEFWFDWPKYIDTERLTLEEFKAKTGFEYEAWSRRYYE